MKRILLFVATNLAVVLLLGLVARLLGVDRRHCEAEADGQTECRIPDRVALHVSPPTGRQVVRHAAARWQD